MSLFSFRYLLASVALVVSLQAGAQPARGLIVQLKPVTGADAPAGREIPQRTRERLAAVAQGAGVAMHSQAPVGTAHQLMRFARPLEGDVLEAAMRRMRLHPEVASVEPDVLMKRQVEPNDPDYPLQWHLKTPATGGAAAVNLPPAWDRTTGSAGITVAVLDTGIVKSHPDLAGRFWEGYDFVSEVEYANDGDGRDPDASDPGDWVTAAEAASQTFALCEVTSSTWHGTFIAGQLAALTQNATGVAGVNWSNKTLPVRVSGKCGAWVSDVLDGMRWAAGLPVANVPANPNPARVINLSFGGDAACTSAYQAVIDEVTATGALVVVAGGNNSSQLMRPADCQKVLSVGAVQQNGLKTWYSSYGPLLGLMAPGGSGDVPPSPTMIYSSTNLGTSFPAAHGYGYKQGTSFSTPLASGVASLMLSLNPALTPAQLVARLRAGVRPHVYVPGAPYCSNTWFSQQVCNCTTDTCGPGLLDANLATQLALGPAALIASLPTVAPGATVSLDGRASVAVAGATIVSYQWSLVSGTPVTIQNAGSALASVTLSTAGTWVFSLRVADDLGRTGEDWVTVTAATPDSGGGSTGWLWGLGLAVLAAGAWRRRKHP